MVVFWLANSFLAQVGMRMSLRAQEIIELKNVNLVYQVSDVTAIFLAITTLVLVNGIYDMQGGHIKKY